MAANKLGGMHAVIVYSEDCHLLLWRDARLLSTALKKVGTGDVYAINLDNNTYCADSTGDFVEDALRTFYKAHDGPDEVLICSYIGHGHVQGDDVQSDELAGWAGESNDLKMFGITSMMKWLRDECEAHLLFILDTCFGGTELPPPQRPVREGRIIEHLSSVGPDTEAYGSMWKLRLCRLLHQERCNTLAGMSIEEIHQAIHPPGIGLGPSFYRREAGTKSLVLAQTTPPVDRD